VKAEVIAETSGLREKRKRSASDPHACGHMAGCRRARVVRERSVSAMVALERALRHEPTTSTKSVWRSTASGEELRPRLVLAGGGGHGLEPFSRSALSVNPASDDA
jgi:hypothetical protein